MITHENSYRFFNYSLHVRRKLSNRPKFTTTKLIDEDGTLITDSNKLRERFADTFASNFSDITDKTYDNVNQSSGGNLQQLVDEHIVFQVLNTQRNSVPGPDGIPGVMPKKLAWYLHGETINTNISSCTPYSQGLYLRKSTKITPIYEGSDDRTNSNAHSLTSCIRELLERLIVQQMQKYLHDNQLLSTCQYGFLPGRSTVANFFVCDTRLANIFNDGNNTDVIQFVYTRAFDKVNHSIILT